MFVYLLWKRMIPIQSHMFADLPTKKYTLNTQSLANVPDDDLIRSYWVYNFIARPQLVKLGSSIGEWSVRTLAPARWAIKKTIFKQFCGGESVEDCRPSMKHLADKGIYTILDYSVEGAENENSFDETAKEIALTIKEAATSKNIAFSVFKVSGLGRIEILEDVSRKGEFDNLPIEVEKIVERVDSLCRLSHQLGVRVFIDAEETWIQPFIDHLAVKAMKAYNKERPVVFNTYQLYLKDSLERMKLHAHQVWNSGAFLGTKLVRGAYMEKESARSQIEQRPNPINLTKAETDELFDTAAAFCIANLDKTAFCLGTHNTESCVKLTETMSAESLQNSDERIWFAQLLGMSDNLSYPLAAQGYNVAKYVPYGPVKAVVPYLIRRAQENTTVAGQSSRELMLIDQEMKRRKLDAWRFFLP